MSVKSLVTLTAQNNNKTNNRVALLSRLQGNAFDDPPGPERRQAGEELFQFPRANTSADLSASCRLRLSPVPMHSAHRKRAHTCHSSREKTSSWQSDAETQMTQKDTDETGSQAGPNRTMTPG